MFTNPFERKHSSLMQTLDRFIGETRLSFRKKINLAKRSSANSSASSVSSSSSFVSLQYKPGCNGKR